MFTPEQQQEIVTKRHEIVVKHCKEKGWSEPHTLTIEQVMEIRNLLEWKEVPKKVIATTKPTIGIIGTIGEDGSRIAKLMMAEHPIKPELIIVGGMGMGKTVMHHKADGSVAVINPTLPILPPTAPFNFKINTEPAKPSPASMKSGKELRRERRASERKEKKPKKN